MRIKDNKTGKPEGLPKLNYKPEGCPMLIVKAESSKLNKKPEGLPKVECKAKRFSYVNCGSEMCIYDDSFFFNTNHLHNY